MPVGTFVNPEIIMGYKSPDLSGLDPSRMMQNVLAFKQAKIQQQANELALQQSQQKIADQNLMQEAYNSSDPVNYLRGLGRVDLADAYKTKQTEAQTAELERQQKAFEFKNAVDKAGRENVTTALGNVRDMYTRVLSEYADNLNSPEALKAYIDASRAAHNDEFLGNALKTTGASLANTYTKAQIAYENGTLGNLIQSSAMSADQLRESIKPSTTLGKYQERLKTLVDAGKGDSAEARQLQKAIDLELGGMTESQQRNAWADEQNISLRGQEIKLQQQRLSLDQTKAAANLTDLPIKEIQKREAALPKTKAAFDASNTEIDSLIADLTALANHPGLNLITGARAGTELAKGATTFVNQDAANAQTLINKIKSKGTLRALTDLRNNSPTGAALSNVSNADVSLLTTSFGNLDTKQGTPAFKTSINDILNQLSVTKTRLSNAFDETYSYRSQNAPAASTTQTPPAGGAAQTPPATNERQTKSGVKYTVRENP